MGHLREKARNANDPAFSGKVMPAVTSPRLVHSHCVPGPEPCCSPHEPQKPEREMRPCAISWHRGVGLRCCKSTCCLISRPHIIITPEDVVKYIHQFNPQGEMCCLHQRRSCKRQKMPGTGFGLVWFLLRGERIAFRVWPQSTKRWPLEELWFLPALWTGELTSYTVAQDSKGEHPH